MSSNITFDIEGINSLKEKHLWQIIYKPLTFIPIPTKPGQMKCTPLTSQVVQLYEAKDAAYEQVVINLVKARMKIEAQKKKQNASVTPTIPMGLAIELLGQALIYAKMFSDPAVPDYTIGHTSRRRILTSPKEIQKAPAARELMALPQNSTEKLNEIVIEAEDIFKQNFDSATLDDFKQTVDAFCEKQKQNKMFGFNYTV